MCPQEIFWALIFLKNSSFDTNNFQHCSKERKKSTQNWRKSVSCCTSSKLQWSTIPNCSGTAILPLSQTNARLQLPAPGVHLQLDPLPSQAPCSLLLPKDPGCRGTHRNLNSFKFQLNFHFHKSWAVNPKGQNRDLRRRGAAGGAPRLRGWAPKPQPQLCRK